MVKIAGGISAGVPPRWVNTVCDSSWQDAFWETAFGILTSRFAMEVTGFFFFLEACFCARVCTCGRGNASNPTGRAQTIIRSQSKGITFRWRSVISFVHVPGVCGAAEFGISPIPSKYRASIARTDTDTNALQSKWDLYVLSCRRKQRVMTDEVNASSRW